MIIRLEFFCGWLGVQHPRQQTWIHSHTDGLQVDQKRSFVTSSSLFCFFFVSSSTVWAVVVSSAAAASSLPAQCACVHYDDRMTSLTTLLFVPHLREHLLEKQLTLVQEIISSPAAHLTDRLSFVCLTLRVSRAGMSDFGRNPRRS